jgi:hypothetical protein
VLDNFVLDTRRGLAIILLCSAAANLLYKPYNACALVQCPVPPTRMLLSASMSARLLRDWNRSCSHRFRAPAATSRNGSSATWRATIYLLAI